MKNLEIPKLLPTDKEVEDWYNLNIDENTATVSSSIYKFRLFLKEHLEKKLEPKKHNIAGFLYKSEVEKVE